MSMVITDLSASSYVEDEETHTPFNVNIVAELGQNLLEESQLNIRRIKMLEENDTEKSSEIKQLKETVSQLKANRVRLEDQLSEATQANFSLLKELEYTKNQVRVVTSKDKSYTILAEHYRNTILELESVKAEVQKKELKEVQMKKELNRIEREQREEREHRSNVASSASSEDDSATAADIGPHKALQRTPRRALSTGNIALVQVQAKLEEARAQLDAKNDAFNDLEVHSKQLTEMNLTLIKRINELENEREERKRADQKKKEMEELQELEDAVSNENVVFTRERSRSIASEIESQIRGSLEDQLKQSKDLEVALPKEPVSNVNHNEEYFHMTLQAMKVQFSIKNKLPFSTERVSEKVFLIKSASLYEQVNKEKVAFHEWHKWIKKRLEDLISQMLVEEDDLKKIQSMNQTNSANSKFTSLSKSVTFSSNTPTVVIAPSSSLDSLDSISPVVSPPASPAASPKSSPAKTQTRCCKNFQPQFWKKSLCKECGKTQQEHIQQSFNARSNSSPNLRPILKQSKISKS